jgi:hypothetical protein
MVTRDEFEKDFRTFAEKLATAEAAMGSADAAAEPLEPGRAAQGNEDPAVELRRALPGLAVSATMGEEPDVAFTYEDPIPAVALYWYRHARRVEDLIGSAAYGETAHDGRYEMILAGISDWLQRGSKTFDKLKDRVPRAPLSEAGPTLRIAVLGDAGCAGRAQAAVLNLIEACHRQKKFDYLIHLGDTYFGGSKAEVHSNLIVPLCRLRNRTGMRLLTLCGNHDLYYGPDGYADTLDVFGQEARYFELQTPHWRIACLDTSLAAERKFRNDGELDPGQLTWLKGLLALADTRPLLLMSHHYIVSAWGGVSPTLDSQIGGLIRDKVFAWYWGHEHSCAAYRRTPYGAPGACVGNGCYRERHSAPPAGAPFQPEWYAAGRCKCFGTSKDWPHGFLELELDPEGIREAYHLEDGLPFSRVLPRPGSGRGVP